MAGTVAGAVALLFLLFAVLALAKPFVHALRIAGARLVQPPRALEQPPPLSEPPDLSGVREPRRPTPMGSAGAVALEVDGTPESIDAIAPEGRTHGSSGVDARAA